MAHETTLNTMAQLLTAEDEIGLATQLKKAAASLGFDQFVLGVEVHRPTIGAIHRVTSGYQPAWQRMYLERNYIALDPTVRHCRRHSTPLVWSEALRGGDSAELWEEARSFGIVHGLSIPVRQRAGITSMISLARDRPLGKDLAEAAHLLDSAHILANCAHVATTRILVPALFKQHDPQLTKREKECISWVAHGKTSSEIGDKLNIAEATVIFHLNRTLRKLGVNNRPQAVALSMALGLVE